MYGRLIFKRPLGQGVVVSCLDSKALLWISKKRGDLLTLSVFQTNHYREIKFRIGEVVGVFENFTLQVDQITSMDVFENLRWCFRAAEVYKITRCECFSEEGAVA